MARIYAKYFGTQSGTQRLTYRLFDNFKILLIQCVMGGQVIWFDAHRLRQIFLFLSQKLNRVTCCNKRINIGVYVFLRASLLILNKESETQMGHKMGHTNYYIRRGRNYYFKRRIPKLFQHLYDRTEFIRASLKTDSETIANQRAQLLNAELERAWLSATERFDDKFDDGFQRSLTLAKLSGFTYQDREVLSKGDLEELMTRIESLRQTPELEEEQVTAICGGEEESAYPISQALLDFVEFNKPNLLDKSEDQIRKWKNPRNKAISNFISVCGDLDAPAITRQDILKFRDWWFHRIKEEGKSANSANKDFGYVGQVLGFVRDNKNLPLDVTGLMSKIRFIEKESKRKPFATAYIKDTLLKPKSLEGLHNECRLFIYAMADTGARPSELVGLNASKGDIRLDCDVPFIHIRPDHQKCLKTAQSERMMPLVGAALYAFHNLPGGFEHYYLKSDLLSANVNKFLKAHDLLPSENHSLYSLRHSFEDRLTAVEPPDKVQAALMGHKYHRERYGNGPSLEQKKHWLDKIAFDVTG